MTTRTMYIWKLKPIIDAEGGINRIVDKARRARLSALWVKIADGVTPYSNVTLGNGEPLATLIQKCQARNIEVWGWQVPHCPTAGSVQHEVSTVSTIASKFKLDGLIMDAEGGAEFFQGNEATADAYGKAMAALAGNLGKPLGLSSNDIPQNIGGWLPRFNRLAAHAQLNFPQVYYGGSPSVVNRLDRAVSGNAHLAIPFNPVGAAWIGDGGGCASASACAERAKQFIDLVHERGYATYGFWHWAGAPLAFWEVLNTTAV
jgi:hypothetical protein